MNHIDTLVEKYNIIFDKYIASKKEEDLDGLQDLSFEAIEHDISPEEVVSLHKDLMLEKELTAEEAKYSMDVLLEMIMGFGFSYRDYKALVRKMEAHDKEMDVAVSLQSMMLKTAIPKLDSIEIGAISVPAQRVNGDYFNLIDHKDGTMSFAVADVIGKGIPAALAMSMIKFGMDSYGHSQLPSDGLKRLNRVVEKNVNQNMFVTMFYGLYEEVNSKFYYSSAGHEPGYIYREQTDSFQELNARGIVLGINPSTRYDQKEHQIEIGDMIIVFTDGFSEIRRLNGEFVSTEELLEIIREYKHLHPQDIVQVVYEELLKQQDPKKRDDLTILIIKKIH
ncbi:PP2C family protein-serine/threonine phosphatase [Macrococcus equipercicus]|uniref:PP2C family protein-serine/threonine phosphatase n=1 Tax=Macrococcus equipercicus TaxID=69967 RepID=A0A9Q9F103_9STAP|nr:PP2C family protein-serine/threonine phosphatase [Macrococcus equipercicus]KAA1039223.1 PP2C family protein-serine/threonine phosphatase [Macrococcus equipercicus]UTH13513.1 PP2C family protein-serine/threonine phosphatase [Macrococcus equipercicus]